MVHPMVSPDGETSSPGPWGDLLQPLGHAACTLLLPAKLEGLLAPGRKGNLPKFLGNGWFLVLR